MDNIILSKKYQEDNLIQLYIQANSKYVSVRQDCYIEDKDLLKNADKLFCFLKDKKECYLEFGVKTGNYTPAFSMKLNSDKTGHIQIEMDMEIADNSTRAHRCCFFVKTEEGLLEKFAKSIKLLPSNQENVKICLNEDGLENGKSLN